jgi:hypothetical protein
MPAKEEKKAAPLMSGFGGALDLHDAARDANMQLFWSPFLEK